MKLLEQILLKKKTAVIYTRVSTDEQAEKGFSLRDQEEKLRKYCEDKGINVVAHFQDDASAKTFNRPKFQEFLKFAEKNKRQIDYLLVVKWDRFSRNIAESYAKIMILKDQGIVVNAIEQSIDPSIPESELLLALYLAYPQVENDRRGLNTKTGMRKGMKEGKWMAKPPKGYRFYDKNDHKKIIPNEDAHFVIEAFQRVANDQETHSGILKDLQNRGFQCEKSQFGRLLRNIFYLGKIHISAWQNEDEEIVQGEHKSLISEELFIQVQIKLKGNPRNKHKTRKPLDEKFPLKGFLICQRCNKTLTKSTTTGNGGKYEYYHCKGCEISKIPWIRADQAHESFIYLLQSIHFSPGILELFYKTVRDISTRINGDNSQQINKFEAELKNIENQLFLADSKFINEEIDRDSYNRFKISYSQKKIDIEGKKDKLQVVNESYSHHWAYVCSLLSQIDVCYEKASFELKQKMIGSVFGKNLIFDGKECRTKEENQVIALLTRFSKDISDSDKKKAVGFDSFSHLVTPRGLEPLLQE